MVHPGSGEKHRTHHYRRGISDVPGSTVSVRSLALWRMMTSGVSAGFPVPTPNNLLTDLTVGPDKNIWFTEYNSNKIGQAVLSSSAYTM